MCGDGVCNGGETTTSCQADCPVCLMGLAGKACTETTN